MKSTCCNSALARQVLQWEQKSQELVAACPCQHPKEDHLWFWFEQLAHLSFKHYYLVCFYSRKMALLEKGWIRFFFKCSVYILLFFGVFFVLGTAVPVVVIGICWGNEQNWKCQLLLLCSNPDCDGNIDTNSSSKSVSYAEEVLLWMPGGVYCNPSYPCASLLQHCPCRKIGRILLIPHSHPELGTCCVLNICFPPALCCHGSRTWPNKCTFFGAMSVNFLSVHF